MSDWISALELPGIVPVNGTSRMAPFAPLADPTFYNLDTDFGADPLPKGDKTQYQLATTRTGLMRRSWITWGWEEVDCVGYVRLQHDQPYTDPPFKGQTAPIEFDTTLGGMIVPSPKSADLWNRFSTLGGVDRQHAYDAPYPYWGANTGGNVTTAAGESLNWQTPLQGTAWKTLVDVPVGPAGLCYAVNDPTSPATFFTINHNLRVQGRFYGNTGCVRDTSKKYYSIVHLELRAFWMPDREGTNEEDAFNGYYNWLVIPDVDASTWYPPRSAVASNYVDPGFFPGYDVLAGGSIHFNAVSSGYYGQANYAGDPTIWNFNQPMPPAVEGEEDIYPDWAVNITFKNPFHWTMPAPL